MRVRVNARESVCVRVSDIDAAQLSSNGLRLGRVMPPKLVPFGPTTWSKIDSAASLTNDDFVY